MRRRDVARAPLTGPNPGEHLFLADALQVGDLLEGEDGRLRICKYVGFEPAQWVLPEPKAALEKPPVELEPAGQSAAT